MKKTKIAVLALILLSFLIGIYAYSQFPEQVASHWNANGEVDGYISKFWGAFLLPIVLVGLFILFTVIPKIDPLRANIEKFRKHFDGFIVLISLFLFYVYALTLIWNLGGRFDMTTVLTPALGVLFFYIGVMTENAKQNWFIGIRTPWTLSSEKVWDKTHQIGGKLFKAAGVIAALGVFFGNLAIYFVLVPVIGVAVFTIVYSYLEYQKLNS